MTIVCSPHRTRAVEMVPSFLLSPRNVVVSASAASGKTFLIAFGTSAPILQKQLQPCTMTSNSPSTANFTRSPYTVLKSTAPARCVHRDRVGLEAGEAELVGVLMIEVPVLDQRPAHPAPTWCRRSQRAPAHPRHRSDAGRPADACGAIPAAPGSADRPRSQAGRRPR